eukprot:510325-Amphidinium_carterae.1
MRRVGMSTSMYCERFNRELSFVLDTAVVAKVLATESWSSVESELSALVRSSNLGARLFGFCIQHVTAGRVDTLVNSWVEEVESKPPPEITATLKAEWQIDLCEKLEEAIAEDPGQR